MVFVIRTKNNTDKKVIRFLIEDNSGVCVYFTAFNETRAHNVKVIKNKMLNKLFRVHLYI
jgi:hypothetical protein